MALDKNCNKKSENDHKNFIEDEKAFFKSFIKNIHPFMCLQRKIEHINFSTLVNNVVYNFMMEDGMT